MIQRKTLDIVMEKVPRRYWRTINDQVTSPEGFVIKGSYLEDNGKEEVTHTYRAKVLAFCFRLNGVTVEYEITHADKPEKETLMLKENIKHLLLKLIK